MTGKTHVAFGTASLVAYSLNHMDKIVVGSCTVLPIIGVITVAIGAYLPDIDIPESHLGRKVTFISKHLTHRGITHTLLIPAVTLGILYTLHLHMIIASLVYGFLFGYLSHIFADAFNKKGVPIFWPLMTSRFHVMSVKTRSSAETLWLLVVLMLSAIYALGGYL